MSAMSTRYLGRRSSSSAVKIVAGPGLQYSSSLDTRLTESGNAGSKQLLVMPTESLTNREWLPAELLSGSERRRPSWFLDVKYQIILILVKKDLVHDFTYVYIQHALSKIHSKSASR